MDQQAIRRHVGMYLEDRLSTRSPLSEVEMRFLTASYAQAVGRPHQHTKHTLMRKAATDAAYRAFRQAHARGEHAPGTRI